MLGQSDLILSGEKRAALPVMMEARPGGEDGDRSALDLARGLISMCKDDRGFDQFGLSRPRVGTFETRTADLAVFLSMPGARDGCRWEKW